MSDAPSADHPGTTCPVCSAPAQRGQLVCLECGSRITLSYRRPPSWKVPVAITVAVLVLAGAGGALAYRAIDDDAKREAAASPANPKPRPDPPAAAPTKTETATTKETDTRAAPAPKDDEINLGDGIPGAQGGSGSGGSALDTGGLRKSGDFYQWPRTLRAFTVVLLSAEDRPSAASFARSAGGSGADMIGVIRSNDFETLPKGFFVVFAGEYPDRRQADRAAGRLGKRFPGAFAQLVRK